MDPQGSHVPVFVIAGSWECSDKGIWDFYIAKECYARSISMNVGMSYEDLILAVRKEFELEGLSFKPKLSYWLPCQLSVFAVNSRPPVIITSTTSVRNFLAVKETAVHLNLLLSLEPETGDDIGVRLRKSLVPAEKGKDFGGDETAEAYAAVLPIEEALPDSRYNLTSKHSGVRRRLFVDTDASCSKTPIKFISVPSSSEESRKNDCGIIRLGDADTPSLSAHSEDNNATGIVGLRDVSAEEDEELIRAVEDVEKRQNELRMRKGKGKYNDTEVDTGSNHTEDSDTDGLVSSGTEDDDLCDEDYWNLAFDSQYPFDFNASLFQLGQPTTDVISPIVEDGRCDTGEEDIGAAVLSYVTREREEPQFANEDNLGGEVNIGREGNLGGEDNVGGEGNHGGEDNVAGNASPGFYDDYLVANDSSGFSDRNQGGTSGLTFAVGNHNEPGSSAFGVNDQPGPSSSVVAVEKQATASSALPLATQLGDLEDVFVDYTQRGDAEPVFDDIYQVTNTDGCAIISAEEDAIYIGRVFKSKEDLQNTLAIYAIKRLFHFRQTKSDRKRVICVCIDRHCRWRVFAHRVSQYSENYEIRRATLTHTCSITSRSQYEKQASAKVIAAVLKDKYANGLPGPRAVDIPDIVLAELKVSVTYMKAWYAKEAALLKSRGSDEKSYKLLAVYMYLLEKGNPGTVYKLEYTGGGAVAKQFKYLFFALGASIAGIKFMRKVVLVDATAIKNKFMGVLMTASMQDANFQVFPIAFGIVDAENDLAWTWFFTQLSSLVPDAEDIVLVSDRHRSIYSAVRKVYPLAFHGACAVHIERNVNAKFPGTGLSSLVCKAARAFNYGDYKEWYAEIERRDKRCAAFLDAIPLEHWTQAFCKAKRYNMMSSNIAEALNGALAKIVELPIVSMVESIRTKLMEWFCFRRERARKLLASGEPITPNVNTLLLRHHTDSAGLAVKPVSAWSFQVSLKEKKFYVDLAEKTCSCLQFQKLEIPCCHALAAARRNGVPVPALVGEHYTVKVFGASYEKFIFPVPNECDVQIPVNVQETEFIPPKNKNGPGRRRKRRIPSTGEYQGSKRRKTGPHKCSTCHQKGHNRATCKNMPG